MKYDFYLASPFFNDEQRKRERKICTTLRTFGYSVFAPFENGVLNAEATEEDRNKIFVENVENIKNSDRIIAITDGKDIGTIWEAGYGYGIGKEIIYYAETLGNNPFNVMLGKSAIGIFTDYDKFMLACGSNNFNNKEYEGIKTQ